MKKLYIFIAVFGIILFLYSCGKKWKEPTDVTFNFKLNANSNNGLIKFTSCNLNLSELSFDGERKQGDKTIDFEKKYSGLQINFSQTLSNTGIIFQIPQGAYTRINVGFSLDTILTEIAMQLNGLYFDLAGDTVPVQFKLSLMDAFEVQAINSDGGNEINLVAGRPAKATIVLNPSNWFANITQSELEQATQNIDSDETSISIDIENESNLYNLIINRISEGNEVVFE